MRRTVGLLACGLLSACGNSLPLQTPATPALPAPPALPDSSTSRAMAYCSPAGTQKAAVSATIGGMSAAILPTGRIVTPAGTEVNLGVPKPFELAVSPDGKYVATVNNGSGGVSVTLVGALPSTTVTKLSLASAYLGVAFSPDSKTFYVSGGDAGVVYVGSTGSRSIIGAVNLNGSAHRSARPLSPTAQPVAQPGPYAGRLALTSDGKTLYVVDEDGFEVFAIDTTKIVTGVDSKGNITEPDNFAAIEGSFNAGRHPFGIALSADDSRLYVSNVGIYQYSHYRPANPTGDSKKDYPVCYPAAGWPDETLADRYVKIKPIDSHVDKLPDATSDPDGIQCSYVAQEIDGYRIPALGDPNVAESSSVWIYDLGTPTPTVVQKLKTGALIGQVEDGIVTRGGDHPNAIVVGHHAIYVSNGTDDSISEVDPVTLAERRRIPLTPLSDYDAILKGVQPWDLALSPDESRLYVAEAGLSAVGVIDLAADTPHVIGHIPTGWWTSGVRLSADGSTIFATSARDRGAEGCDPNNIKLACSSANDGTFGALHIIPVPDATTLAADTQQVLSNNGITGCGAPADGNPIPNKIGMASSAIKHVIVMKKENAKFDYMLGDIVATRSGQPVDGEPAFAIPPELGTTGEPASPNHHEIALQFALADNYYSAGSVSADGHRWLQGFYTSEWEETHWTTAYGGGGSRDSGSNPDVFTKYPGRMTNHGSDSGPEPHDYTKHGDLYDHLARHGISFFNFGMGYEFSELEEPGYAAPTGAVMHVNIPMSKTLRDNSDHLFPTFNTSIPDAPLPDDPNRYNRFDRFKQVFEHQFVDRNAGVCKLPQYVDIYYENDHTGGANSIESNWTGARYTQDNDAAVGMTVDLISHSPCWQDTVLFFIEDDAQSGIDHVSPYRSILVAASPWIKRQYVSHVNLTVAGLNKTIFEIFGLPPLNLYDALATDMRDLFTSQPDVAPYNFITPCYQPTGTSADLAQPLPCGVTAGKSDVRPRSKEDPIANAALWDELTRDIDFAHRDADECRLNRALIRYFGLPRPPYQSIADSAFDACLEHRDRGDDDDD